MRRGAQTAVSQATNVAPTNQTVSDENTQAIIVTAQKRAQVLLEVPQSVTVVGGETLERQQATNFQDYFSLVPGLSVESGTPGESADHLARREHRRRRLDRRRVHGRSPVRIEHGPCERGHPVRRLRSVRHLNRIEVLRGPQGTLYGASSFGGVLRYITNAPKLKRFEVRAQAGIEDTHTAALGYNAAAIVNVPLGDKAAIRINGFLPQGSRLR